MTRAIRAVCWATLLATAGVAQGQAPEPATSPEPSLGDPMPDRVVTYPGGVTALADVTYSTMPGYRPLILDVYRPAERAQPKPLIVYVHGGGWQGGHTRQSGAFSDFPAVLAELAGRGYVVASVEYRLSAEAPFPAALDDVRSAVRFLKANASKYGIDPSRVGLFGGSAGGQLAVLEALACGSAPTGADKSNAEVSDCPQAAVGWYGIYDFGAMPGNGPNPVQDRYLGCTRPECSEEQLSAPSAVAHVDRNDPPVLLLHGDADTTVPVAQSQRLAERIRASGASVELEIFPGIGHSWIGADPAETRAASLRALDLTYRFFDRHLRGGR